ncbi:MAG TPA: serine hydrolase [Bacteroidales bacterium]|nr:serine hydrolase [Bacteroidales bacterium]
MKRFLTILFIQTVIISVAVSAGPSQRIDSLMKLYHEHNNFYGAVLVAKNGEVLFSGGYGLANIEHGVPNTPNTRFRIASISKQFTAMLVLQQVAAGNMELSDPIRRFIPDYPAPQGDIITIHHLLSHTSGFPHYAGIPDFFQLYGRREFTHREFVELFWDLDLLFEPGTRFNYSSFGFYLLGYILERVTDKQFPQLLREKILAPLGMNATGIVDHEEILPNKASGYDLILNGFQMAEFRDLSTALATGDMYTSPLDMVKWDRALRQYTLLDKELQDRKFDTVKSGFGYGWVMGYHSITENDSVFFQRHTGGTNGFTSIGTRLLPDGYYILVFCNTRPGEIRPVERDIIRILYGHEPQFRPSSAIKAARLLESQGKEAAINFLRTTAVTGNPDQQNEEGEEQLAPLGGLRFETRVADILQVGNDLIRVGRNEEAITFMRLATEKYPESVPAWLALGDRYHAAGKKYLAIQAYARALTINPEHRGALERIKRY